MCFMNDSTESRLWARLVVGDGCWEWKGSHTTAGYGNMWVSATQRIDYVHRIAYEILVGPIPEKYDVDHRCRNRGCCNPSHLEPVPHDENVRRGLKGVLSTHCLQGHPWDEVNTGRTRQGWRRCRTCHRINERERSARRRTLKGQ